MKNLKRIFSAVLIFAMVMTFAGAYAADEKAVDIDYDKKTAGFGETYNTADGGMDTRGGSAEFKYYQNDKYGADSYLKIVGTANLWNANSTVREAIKSAKTFVYETSILLTPGSASTHLIRNKSSKETTLFKLGNGSVTVNGTTVAKYENYKWYQFAAVYDDKTLTLYMNGEKLGDYSVVNGYSAEDSAITRLGLWFAPADGGYVAYRYIKIYSADSFDASNYSAALTAKDTAKITKVTSTISTNKTNLTELCEDLNIPAGAEVKLYDKKEDGTYALNESGTIDAAINQTLIVTSANKKTIKYYDLSYDSGISEDFTMTFEGTDAPENTADVQYSYAENYKGNATQALKASLNTGTTGAYPGSFIDKTVKLSNAENFLIQGKFALNKSSFNISFPNNKKLTPFNANGVEIKGTDAKLATDGNEWMSFAVYYNAETKKLAAYIDGVLLEETDQSEMADVTKIRFYFGFTKSIGEGDVYIDDLKLTHGAGVTYNNSDDVITVSGNSGKEVYIHKHIIYTNSPDTIETDVIVSEGVEGLSNSSYGSTLVLKKGNSIKTFLVKAIPQYALIEDAGVNSEKTKVTAAVYDFEGTKTTYRLILAEYTDDTLNKVYIGGNGEKTVDFSYTNGNRYVLYAWSDLTGMIPISGAWTLNI